MCLWDDQDLVHRSPAGSSDHVVSRSIYIARQTQVPDDLFRQVSSVAVRGRYLAQPGFDVEPPCLGKLIVIDQIDVPPKSQDRQPCRKKVHRSKVRAAATSVEDEWRSVFEAGGRLTPPAFAVTAHSSSFARTNAAQPSLQKLRHGPQPDDPDRV